MSGIKTAVPKNGRSPYMLLHSDLNALELYQSIQSKPRFKMGGLVAGFVGTPTSETLFFGLYRVESVGTAPQGLLDPVRGHDAGGKSLYRLQPADTLSRYRRKLTIDWGKGYINWCVNAASSEKPVLELLRDASLSPFPGFRAFRWNVKDIETIPENWKEVLRAVKGIYALTCMETGKIYVGSAKGSDSLYGRFCDYAANGNGGNTQLKKRKKRDYQVSVLEIRHSDHEIESVEQFWMDKFLTRKFGLNGAEYPPGLVPLSKYQTIFASPGFVAGEWRSQAASPDQAQLPYFEYSSEVHRFIKDAYTYKWVMEDFDWVGWKETEQAGSLSRDEERLAGAAAHDLYRLLTTILRGDRFVEGTLADAFESGLVLRIVRRAAEIVNHV